MTDPDQTTTLRKIKRLYGRIVVLVGTAMGFVLIIFLFTLGIMIDGGHITMLELEVPAIVLLVLGLIFLKPLSLSITRLLLTGSADSRRVLKGMTAADVEKLPQ